MRFVRVQGLVSYSTSTSGRNHSRSGRNDVGETRYGRNSLYPFDRQTLFDRALYLSFNTEMEQKGGPRVLYFISIV